MTSSQLSSLNSNLKPSTITLSQLSTSDDIRNQLVYFFYQLKHNHDKYVKGLKVCPVKITWVPTTTPNNGALVFNNIGDTISGVLAVELYKYILRTSDSSNFIAYVKEAFRLDNLFKKQAYHYFKNNICCDNQSIANYQKYYFMQSNRFIGNR